MIYLEWNYIKVRDARPDWIPAHGVRRVRNDGD